MKYSDYQIAFFDAVKNGSGNVALNAVAGSGKTTTICESAKQINGSILMSPFGKDIEKELKTRGLPGNVTIQTNNALGWGAVRQRYNPKLSKNKNFFIVRRRYDLNETSERIEFYAIVKHVCRLIDLFKSNFVLSVEEATKLVPEYIEYYGLTVSDRYEDILCDVFSWAYDESLKDREFFDFNDQLLVPITDGLLLPHYDTVYIDEFQDTNNLQFELLSRVADRFIVVGDPDQAIYGFRGATPDAFNHFTKALGAEILPLSICYRCGSKIIEEAQTVVPRIEANPNGHNGLVTRTDKFEPQKGDYILCRTVAPLVSSCLQMLKEGHAAVIRGQSIKETLNNLVVSVTKKRVMQVDTFLDALEDYCREKIERLERRGPNDLAEQIRDSQEALEAICTNVDYTYEIDGILAKIFDQVNPKFTYMSIHKSKGLENDRVIIMRPDLLPHPKVKTDWGMEEERRLKYVAITRAKKELIWTT